MKLEEVVKERDDAREMAKWLYLKMRFREFLTSKQQDDIEMRNPWIKYENRDDVQSRVSD